MQNKYKQKITPSTTTENWTDLSAKETRKKVFRYYKTNYQNKLSVYNEALGIEIKFDRTGSNKMSFGGKIYPAKACSVEILDQLLQYAEYSNWGERKSNDAADVKGYLNFKAKAFIDNKIEYLHLVLRVKNDGSYHYSLEINIW